MRGAGQNLENGCLAHGQPPLVGRCCTGPGTMGDLRHSLDVFLMCANVFEEVESSPQYLQDGVPTSVKTLVSGAIVVLQSFVQRQLSTLYGFLFLVLLRFFFGRLRRLHLV